MITDRTRKSLNEAHHCLSKVTGVREENYIRAFLFIIEASLHELAELREAIKERVDGGKDDPGPHTPQV